MTPPLRSASVRPLPGFTLIELLTVIAIIGILAAILIPTVGKVRQTARGAQCLSNQRQIGLAFNLYANDNKGYLPRSGMQGNVVRTWMLSVQSYIPSNNNIINHKIYLCPSAPEQPPADFVNSSFHYSASFALEAGNAATVADGLGTPPNGPRHITSIIRPSRTVLLYDGVIDPSTYRVNSSRTYTIANTDMGLAGPDAPNFQALSFRHGDAINIAYVDGHASRVPWSDRRLAIPDTFAWNGKQ